MRIIGAVLCLVGLAGCALPSGQWRWPYVPMTESPSAASVPSEEAMETVERLLGEDRPDGLIRTLRQVQSKAGEDETLYQLGLLLLTPRVGDFQGAQEAMTLLLARYPDSPRKRSAEAVARLLKTLEKTNKSLSKMGVENRVLRSKVRAIQADMERIVNIDLETERQRLVDTPDEPVGEPIEVVPPEQSPDSLR